MNAREWGIALLCCVIPGDDLRPLTTAQLRTLGQRVRAMGMPAQPSAILRETDLAAMGYTEEEAWRICALLDRELRLEHYLDGARARNITLLTRLSPEYPERLHHLLGTNAPPLLFAAGNLELLNRPAISLVGSRALKEAGKRFARRVGSLAAREGFVLVSGNAAGADREGQTACLQAGGSIIAFVADELSRHVPRDESHQLILSESGYDLPFSPARALHRNHLIHALGEKTFVAQCAANQGGTWSGTTENLRRGWSEVYVCDDGSEAMHALCDRGANLLREEDLRSLSALQSAQCSLFE
ncbi:MAG: DNA-processing protein DprA [Ruminococcaceae bacterium]|nr:DNA-processing protein DprA [Oscillospiraceae bacterium]